MMARALLPARHQPRYGRIFAGELALSQSREDAPGFVPQRYLLNANANANANAAARPAFSRNGAD
jgi:hypothetical protein